MRCVAPQRQSPLPLLAAVLLALLVAPAANADRLHTFTDPAIEAQHGAALKARQEQHALDAVGGGNRPLTQAELEVKQRGIMYDNMTATAAFLKRMPEYNSAGAAILMIVTLRVYSVHATKHMKGFLCAHMQGTRAVQLQLGLVADYHFVNFFSSSRGPLASAANQALVHKFHLEDMSAFDLIFSFGLPPGQILREPLTASYLVLVEDTLAYYVTQAGFHEHGWHFPVISCDWPANFCNAEPVYDQQQVHFTMRLTGRNLIPFIPERQTLAMLAFRDAFHSQNSTVRNQNVTWYHEVQGPTTGRRRMGGDTLDVVDIILRAITYPVDVHTPRQVMNKALRDNAFEHASARLGMPMTTALLNATMETVRRSMKGVMLQRHVTGMDELSGFQKYEPLDRTATRDGHAVLMLIGNRNSMLGSAITVAVAAITALVLTTILAGALLMARRIGLLGIDGASSTALSQEGSLASTVSKRSSLSLQSNQSSSASHRILALLGRPVLMMGAESEMVPLARRGGQSDEDVPESPREEISFSTDSHGRPIVLGRGSWGHIYLARRWGTQEVAVKVIDRVGHSDSWVALLRREVAMLQKVSFDRNIVQYYGACLENDRAMLVMEYCAGGDLRGALLGKQGPQLAWYRGGRVVALDVARGLRYCHATGVIHRDLKSSNVLLTAEGVAKIGDVGLARLISAAEDTSLVVAGTFSFAAPEMLMGLKVTEKSDSYSFGVLLWEIATHEVPMRGQMRELRCPQEAPEELADLIEACMEVDPAARPTSQEIFERLQTLPQPDYVQDTESD